MTGVGLLKGVRVLDLTLFLSGPYATQILGDLGAEVIKVEPPDGDNTRVLPPNFVGGESAYFLSCNRNKRGVVIDYKQPDGRALLEELAKKCDVLIENLKPGALLRYGISYERMREINPRLVYCSISGFGQDGPYRERPAYDMVVQALSGGMSLTGEPDGHPVRAGIPLADLSAGMYAVIGILAALNERNNTGVGKYLDIAMLDCQVAMLSYQAAYYLASGEVPRPQGRRHESIPSYRAFTGRDGVDFVICANTDRMWRSLCEAIGRADLRDDPRLQTRNSRYFHRDEIWKALESAFLERDAEDWVERLLAVEVPVGTVNTLDRVMEDPQVQHRGMVLELHREDGTRLKVAGNPIKVPAAGREAHDYPPALGGDTIAVLRGLLGMQAETIADLAARGVIGSGTRAGNPPGAHAGEAS